MATKQTFRWAVACGTTLAIGTVWLSFSWLPTRVQAAALPRAQEQNWSALDGVAFSELDTLRRQIVADDDTLASLDLTQQQATDLLGRLRTWYENNTETTHAAWKADADERSLARLAKDAAARGAEVPSRGEPSTALADALTAAGNAAFTGMSNGQLTQIAGMKTRRAFPMPYRVLDLDAGQQNALRALLTRQSLRASSAQAEGHATEPLDGTELQQAIGQQNGSTLQTFLGQQAEASRRVIVARNTVIPKPADAE